MLLFLDMAKQKILLIEDEANVSLVLKTALEHEGYDVTAALDGEEGLRLALSGHPDLILVDLLLPKMGGMDMIRALRRDETWGKDAEVFVLTNINDMATFETAIHQGAYRYIIKGDTPLAGVVAKIKTRLQVLSARGTA